MSDDLAISINNVTKAYRVWDTPSARFISPLQAALGRCMPSSFGPAKWLKTRSAASYQDFYALKDISFSVKRGEAVGIIGRNGSGKSTLLQVIARTLQPTSGKVTVNGRVAALLELGSGFNPEFTGRENVYLNGAVLGLSRAEIDARFDSIASFADIGAFIEQPVKTYSSGMMMRLAFSVQIAVEPEILIVDEALSVGDAQFVAKCIKRVSDFLREGRTLLFVSHDIGLVKQLTSRALYLDQGQKIAFDDTVAVTLAYNETLTASNNAPSTQNPDLYSAPHAPYSIEKAMITRDGFSPLENISEGDPALIIVDLKAAQRSPGKLVFSIYNYLGIIVCSGAHELPPCPAAKSQLQVRLELPRIRLAPGSYRMNFAVRNEIEIMSWARNAISFRITGNNTETYIYREETVISHHFS